MTTFTPNFNLDLYEGTDKPDLADQYAAAMGKIDEALQAALTARAALANEISTLIFNLTATNSQVETNKDDIATNTADIETLKTVVAKNTPLVEAHAKYFTDLGVTDDQSARDLHTQIDQSHQGVMSNTAELAIHDKEIKQLSTSAVAAGFDINFQDIDIAGLTASLGFGSNPNGNTFKFFGRVVNLTSSAINVPLVPIPGRTNAYGYKIDAFHIDTAGKAYAVDWIGVLYNPTQHTMLGRSSSWSLGSDGYVYIFNTNTDSYSVDPGNTHMWFQIPVMLSEPWDVPEVTG